MVEEVFYTSDHHFGHARIVELTDRPFGSVEEMNEVLVARWNAVVKPHDVVYHLGDLCMGTFMESVQVLERLNGQIMLVPGNHDRVSSTRKYSVQKQALFELEYIKRGVYVLPEHLYGVGKAPIRETFNMSHYPYEGDSQAKDRYSEMRPVDDGKFLLHGHVHEKWKVNGRMINVGVDVWDFTPVHVDTLAEVMNRE